MATDASSRQLLTQARDRTDALWNNLMRQQSELRPSPRLDAAKLETLRRGMNRAADASRRLVKCLDQSLNGLEEPSK